MFTGIIQAVGHIVSERREGDGLRIAVSCGPLDVSDVRSGDSIAVSGCCLTAVSSDDAEQSLGRGDGEPRSRLDCALHRATAGIAKGVIMDLTTLERLPLWIGGRAVPAHTTRYGEITNPATGEVLRHVPLADADDISAAASAAVAPFPRCRASPPLRR